jgi:hypothetical protein
LEDLINEFRSHNVFVDLFETLAKESGQMDLYETITEVMSNLSTVNFDELSKEYISMLEDAFTEANSLFNEYNREQERIEMSMGEDGELYEPEEYDSRGDDYMSRFEGNNMSEEEEKEYYSNLPADSVSVKYIESMQREIEDGKKDCPF